MHKLQSGMSIIRGLGHPSMSLNGGLRFMRGFAQLLTAVLGFALVGACASESYTGVSRNFELTLDLLVDGKPTAFSVVQRLTFRKLGGNGGAFAAAEQTVNGDALVASLGQRHGLIVALMRTPHNGEDGYRGMFLSCVARGASDVDQFLAALKAFQGSCSLSGDSLPTIAQISNPRDPNTIRGLAPEVGHEVAPGIEFVDLRLAATDRPLTDTAILSELPWLSNPMTGANIYGQPTWNDTPNGLPLSKISFVRRSL